MEIYCVKCRKPTETLNAREVTTKNNRRQVKGICAVCGSKKARFIGGSILNKAINNLPFELHLLGHNFTGPGTKLNERLNPDGTPKEWSKPVNRVDEAAMHHDICYSKHKATKTRNRICDQNMLDQLDGIYDPTIRERFERGIVRPIIGTKQRFGWGVKKKLLGQAN